MNAPYQILPQLAQDDLQRLKASIIERGVEVPVIVDENGTIIDGHHRAMIADSLGKEYPKEVRAGLSEAQKRLLAVELNIARRQLTDGQKLLLAEQMRPAVAAEAMARKRSTQFGSTGGDKTVSTGEKEKDSTRQRLADAVGYGSGTTLYQHSRLLDELRKEPDGEHLIKHVEDGDWDMSDVRKELKSRQRMRREPDPVPRSEPKIRPIFNDGEDAKSPKQEAPKSMDGADAALAISRLVGVETADAEDTASYLIHMDKDPDTFTERMLAITAQLGEIARYVSQMNRERKAAA